MSTDLPRVKSLGNHIIPVVFLFRASAAATTELNDSLSTPDGEWLNRPTIEPPTLSFISWPRSLEGTNTDIYRIAAQAKDKHHSSLIFLDGKSAKDGSVLISRMLDNGELTIRYEDRKQFFLNKFPAIPASRIFHNQAVTDSVLEYRRTPAGRATLGLKACQERGVGVKEAPIGKFSDGLLPFGLLDPWQLPFSHDQITKTQLQKASDPTKLMSVPEEVSQARPILISLVPGLTLSDLVDSLEPEDRTSAADIDFYPWTGASEATRADLFRVFYLTKFRLSDHDSVAAWSEHSDKLFLVKDQNVEGQNSLLYARHQMGKRLTIYRIAPKEVFRAWSVICGYLKRDLPRDNDLFNLDDLERMVDPDGYMWGKDQSPWKPDGFQTGGVPPAFYLVELLPDEQKRIEKELGTFTDIDNSLLETGDMDEKKYYCFVPWENKRDGTDLDMLRIFKETGLESIIFIDRKSAENGSVILTASHIKEDYHDGKSHFRKVGMEWGRTPGREARLSWVNLDIANMNIEEVVEDGATETLLFEELEKIRK